MFLRARKRQLITVLAAWAALALSVYAGENLRINPKLDYNSDSQDGPLITGDHMDKGALAGKPNYIIFYGEGCFNSKRQARRTVSLYGKYKGRVNFVIVDLDRKPPLAQQPLIKKYFQGSIPHVTILDKSGKAVYDAAGEAEESKLSGILDQARE